MQSSQVVDYISSRIRCSNTVWEITLWLRSIENIVQDIIEKHSYFRIEMCSRWIWITSRYIYIITRFVYNIIIATTHRCYIRVYYRFDTVRCNAIRNKNNWTTSICAI